MDRSKVHPNVAAPLSQSLAPETPVRENGGLVPGAGSLALRLAGAWLAVLAVVVSLPIWIGTALGLVALDGLLGHPTGTLGAVLGSGYIVVSIGLTAIAVVWLVRRLRPVTSRVQRLEGVDDDEDEDGVLGR